MSSLPETTGDFPSPFLHPITDVAEHYDAIGQAAELAAHALSTTRAVGGVLLARHIESTPADYRNWGTVAAFVTLAATDGEGYAARWGRRRQGKDESKRRPFNAWIDHIADKLMVDPITDSVADREIEEGNLVYGGVLKTVSRTYVARDVVTSIDRLIAEKQDIDTRAQGKGKRKTVEQLALLIVAVSPLSKNKVVRTGLGLGFLHSAGVSVRSGWSMHKSFREQRNAMRTR